MNALFAFRLLRWISLPMTLVNAAAGFYTIMAGNAGRNITADDALRFHVTEILLVTAPFLTAPTFFFFRRQYIWTFAVSGAAALGFCLSDYSLYQLRHVWFSLPWSAGNIFLFWALWRERALNPDMSAKDNVRFSGIPEFQTLKHLRSETSGDVRRISFGIEKDAGWVASGLVVTVDKDQRIIGAVFHSTHYGVARWSAGQGGTSTKWEEIPAGRRKWSSSLGRPAAQSGVDQNAAIDVLRSVKSPALRKAIGQCLAGETAKWDKSYEE